MHFIDALLAKNDFEAAIESASKMVFLDNSLWESPIERTLGTSLFMIGWNYMPTFIFKSIGQPECFKAAYKRFSKSTGIESILIVTQQKIGKYRADFLISTKVGRSIKTVIVEADGHDFHQKTKQQVARDKKRDRFFASLGLQTIRFTGSEIVNENHFDLADEVYQILGCK